MAPSKKPPDPTPDSGKKAEIIQFLKDHWKDILLILEALVILCLILRLLGLV